MAPRYRPGIHCCATRTGSSVSDNATIETTWTKHVEVHRAVGVITGADRVAALMGLTDIEMVPDKVIAEWKMVDGGTWQLEPLEVTGFRVLASGALSETQRGEWCPNPDHPLIAGWVQKNAPRF
jgi:hypothetical protein